MSGENGAVTSLEGSCALAGAQQKDGLPDVVFHPTTLERAGEAYTALAVRSCLLRGSVLAREWTVRWQLIEVKRDVAAVALVRNKLLRNPGDPNSAWS